MCGVGLVRQRWSFGGTLRRLSTAVKERTGEASGLVESSKNGLDDGARDTLGRRLFRLVYTKRSAAIEIAKWREEGHKVQKYQLNRIVRELRKLKRYKHALEVCEWMAQQQELRLLPGDYAVHLDLVNKIRGLKSAEKFFEDLPDKLRVRETCNTLLHVYVQSKLVDQAEALMEKMSECGFLKNALPYNHMLRLYFSLGQMDKFINLVHELKKNTSPDIVTYNLIFCAFASKCDVEGADKLLSDLEKRNLQPDWVTYSTLANLYIKKEFYDKAAATLEKMELSVSRRERPAFSSLVTLYANLRDVNGVLRVWKEMGSLYRKRSDAEYLCMIASLLKLEQFHEAESLYKEWESVSGTGDPRVSNLLLASYINRGLADDAQKFYHRMVETGIRNCYTTWELLTMSSLKRNQMVEALDFLEKAITSVKTWDFDKELIGEISKKLEELGDTDGVERLLVILRKVDHLSIDIYKSLLRTYEKAGKMPPIIAERMRKDSIEPDEEARRLIKSTRTLSVSDVSSLLS